MSEPKDKELYEKVKKNVYKRISEHSAYRSGIIVKEYKEAYFKKHNSKEAYVGKKDTKKGLSRWFNEEWRNQRGGIGYDKKGDIYRPTKKVSKDTPKTYDELSKTDIKKAMNEKKTKGRVKKYYDKQFRTIKSIF